MKVYIIRKTVTNEGLHNNEDSHKWRKSVIFQRSYSQEKEKGHKWRKSVESDRYEVQITRQSVTSQRSQVMKQRTDTS